MPFTTVYRMIHHFILTRYSLSLWSRDKNNHTINKEQWLQERQQLFEQYCLPSMKEQTCKNFEWILLCDEKTPSLYINRLKELKQICPQIYVVVIKSQFAWKFAQVFREIVRKRLVEREAKSGDVCLTTYMDNDDMLSPKYVQKIQEIADDMNYNTFISFDYGKQYFTEIDVTTRIYYPNNHFVTLVEGVENVRTCYGYGSHFYLEKSGVAKVHHISDKDELMWTEVIHKDNVDNDVKMTLNTRILRGKAMNRFRFALRVVKQVYRRCKDKIYKR